MTATLTSPGAFGAVPVPVLPSAEFARRVRLIADTLAASRRARDEEEAVLWRPRVAQLEARLARLTAEHKTAMRTAVAAAVRQRDAEWGAIEAAQAAAWRDALAEVLQARDDEWAAVLARVAPGRDPSARALRDGPPRRRDARPAHPQLTPPMTSPAASPSLAEFTERMRIAARELNMGESRRLEIAAEVRDEVTASLTAHWNLRLQAAETAHRAALAERDRWWLATLEASINGVGQAMADALAAGTPVAVWVPLRATAAPGRTPRDVPTNITIAPAEPAAAPPAEPAA
jgi:hypothetical protein